LKLKDFHDVKQPGTNIQRWKTKKCKHCLIDFPLSDCPPEDVAFVHWERFEFPSVSGDGKSSSGNLRPALIHARYACLIGRYPYVSNQLIRQDAALNLKPEHKLIL